MKVTLALSLALVLLAAATAQAQTTASDAWARATVPQQKASGLFVTLTSKTGGRLVAARSPLAGLVEIHEMSMDKDMMKMRALPAGLELPAGKAVALKPGGFHVMLMDLKRQLKEGDTVPVTLVIQGQRGEQETIELNAPVKALNTPAGAHKH